MRDWRVSLQDREMGHRKGTQRVDLSDGPVGLKQSRLIGQDRRTIQVTWKRNRLCRLYLGRTGSDDP